MRHLIMNEWSNYITRKQSWFFLIFFVLLLTASVPLATETTANENGADILKSQISENNEMLKNEQLSANLISDIESQNKILNYKLENSIKGVNQSVWAITQVSLPLIIIVMIYIISISSGIFQDEVRNKTISNLLLSPQSTIKIIGSKIGFLFLLSTSYILLMFLVTFFVGYITADNYDLKLIDVILVEDLIIERDITLTILSTYFIHLIEIFFISALTVTISIIFNNKVISLLIALGIILGSDHLNIPYIGDYLIFKNLNLTQHLEQLNISNIVSSLTFSIIVNTVFVGFLLAASLFALHRREYN